MRAKEFIVEYKNYPAEDYHGLSFTMKEQDGILLVKALNDYGMPIGYVEFIMDGDELDPQDLWVDEDSRGLGVAKVMYDYIKSRGYIINRSWDQTDAGAGFWNKHRGEDVRVWEDEIEEGWKDWVAGAAMGAAALSGTTDADAKPVKSPQAQHAVAKTASPKTAPVPQHLQIQPGEQFTVLSNNYTNEIALHKVAAASGLKGVELAQFLAQMKHESWNFDRLKEKGQPRVKDYFAKRYDPKFAAKTAKILGNKQVGDGERYKGRGYIQLTGRDNYTMASRALGIDLVKHPELAEKPEVAAKIAVWYWKTRVKPNVTNFADTTAVTRAINPAMRGLQDRHANFLDYKRIL